MPPNSGQLRQICLWPMKKQLIRTLSVVREYTRIKELTPVMLNELINSIKVYQSENVDGIHTQRLNIHYRRVG